MCDYIFIAPVYIFWEHADYQRTMFYKYMSAWKIVTQSFGVIEIILGIKTKLGSLSVSAPSWICDLKQAPPPGLSYPHM